jgi:putative Mg2+ transporter-C (MgtC) family protein
MKIYEIHFLSVDYSLEALEKEMNTLHIRFFRNRIGKQNNVVNVEYNIVVSPKKNREKIDNFLINNTHVKGFEV